MSPEHAESTNHDAAMTAVHRRSFHADRIPKPASCGCGLPVAFDVERKEFFCIGCGADRACTCRRSAWTSTTRPVNVT